jgi:hypothetical protein
MQKNLRVFKISLLEGASFSWPVKIRVRAASPTTAAPRKSPIFPASDPFKKHDDMVLRTLELPRTRPCRLGPFPLESLLVTRRRRS